MTDRSADVNCKICKKYLFSYYEDGPNEACFCNVCETKYPKKVIQKQKEYVEWRKKLDEDFEKMRLEEEKELQWLWKRLSKR